MKLFLSLLAASSLVAATSVPHTLLKRADNSSGLTDGDILNFALTLEHLEAKFYAEGLANYSQSDMAVSNLGSVTRANIAQIGSDEATHVALLTGALSAAGATPVQACTYSFPANSAQGFLGLAQVLEGVGVAAYIGASRYISNPDYLTVAAEILTVEARHNAFIRLANGYSPFPSPFDTALTPKAIVSLAGSFFVSCPDGSAPAIQPFPAASVSTTNYTLGSTLAVTVNASVIANQPQLYCAFASGVTAGFSSFSNGSCQIPTANVTGGQTYMLITTAQNISDASTVAGPVILDIDTKNNTISSSGSSGSSSMSGQTNAKSGAASNFLTHTAAALSVIGGVAMLAL